MHGIDRANYKLYILSIWVEENRKSDTPLAIIYITHCSWVVKNRKSITPKNYMYALNITGAGAAAA